MIFGDYQYLVVFVFGLGGQCGDEVVGFEFWFGEYGDVECVQYFFGDVDLVSEFVGG